MLWDYSNYCHTFKIASSEELLGRIHPESNWNLTWVLCHQCYRYTIYSLLVITMLASTWTFVWGDNMDFLPFINNFKLSKIVFKMLTIIPESILKVNIFFQKVSERFFFSSLVNFYVYHYTVFKVKVNIKVYLFLSPRRDSNSRLRITSSVLNQTQLQGHFDCKKNKAMISLCLWGTLYINNFPSQALFYYIKKGWRSLGFQPF